jgi:hypothetical protein
MREAPALGKVGDSPVKFKVYAIQGVEFNTLEIEADSKEEAIAAYNEKWNGVEVYSVDYRDDKIEYIVEPVPET